VWYLHCPWCETYLGLEFTDEEGADLYGPTFNHMAPACPDCGQQHHMVNCHHYKEKHEVSPDGLVGERLAYPIMFTDGEDNGQPLPETGKELIKKLTEANTVLIVGTIDFSLGKNNEVGTKGIPSTAITRKK
jgi:hypothetical protein